MNDKSETPLACLGTIFVILVALIVPPLLYGWVATILWAWFVVPLFELPPLTIPYAIGLSYLIAMYRSNTVKKDAKLTGAKALVMLVQWFATPLVILLFAWIVKQFIR